ncbi:MAG: NosD domain-containing protein [Thermoplasmata archaeon]
MGSRATVAILAMLILSTLAGISVKAPVTVNEIVTIVYDYVNGSKAVAGALLNFTGPSSQLDVVTFQWFNPNGSLVYDTTSQPDDNGFARSNLTVNQTGEWRVNASYGEPPDVFYHNVSFQVLEDHWDSSFRIIKHPLIIGEAATLTIDAGATIAFDAGMRLSVSGTLIAQGAWNQRIIFTSNSSSPEKGDWNGVYFYSGSGSSIFDFVKVEYAGNGTYVENSSPTIENCTFENNTYGIRLKASTSFLLNNTMKNNTNGFYSFASQPTLISNTAVDNRVGFYSMGSGRFVSQMNIAQGNEQTGFHLDFTVVESMGDTSMGSLVGLRLWSSTGRIEAANISASDDGVYSYGSNVAFYNSTVRGSLRDFFLDGNSSLVAVNSTFGGMVSAEPSCPACYLFVRNYLTIRAIVHETSNPVENAEVKIYDNETLIFFNFTDPQGYIRNITLAHETYENGVRRNNVTMVLVVHPTLVFAYHNRSVDMNVSHVEIFEGSIVDTDGDGEPNFSDFDDDNDGLADVTEEALGTDPLSEDTDGDTMPDGWEHFNVLDPKNPADADEDPDGDGFTNLEEYLNETDPNNPHSHPLVEEQHEEDFLDDLILYSAIILIVTALIIISMILVKRRTKN